MDDSRCKYVNKPCANARSLKDDGSLHRLCAFHRTKANDAQRRWHSRRRSGGVKRRAQDDGGSGGDTDGVAAHYAPPDQPYAPPPPMYHHIAPSGAASAPPAPSPSPKRRYLGPQELPALAEVMMMLRQRRPSDGLGAGEGVAGPHALGSGQAAYGVEAPWSATPQQQPAPPHARYYDGPPSRIGYRHDGGYEDRPPEASGGARYDEMRYNERRGDAPAVVEPLHARAQRTHPDDSHNVSRDDSVGDRFDRSPDRRREHTIVRQ